MTFSSLCGRVAALALCAFPAWAAPAASPPPSNAGALFQVVLGLLVVLALIYALFWLLRRYAPTQTGAQGALKVVGGLMLGPREKLVVVEIGETWLLLGVGTGEVRTLHTMPKPAGYVAPAPGEALPGFAGMLGEILRRRKD